MDTITDLKTIVEAQKLIIEHLRVEKLCPGCVKERMELLKKLEKETRLRQTWEKRYWELQDKYSSSPIPEKKSSRWGWYW